MPPFAGIHLLQPDFHIGSIGMWSGSILDIPEKWILCDGNNDTPDLRDKFLVVAGSSYNPEDIGGAAEHTHDFTSDGHHHQVQTYVYILGGINYGQQVSHVHLQGTTDPKNQLPPYFALCYIMFTGD